MSRRLLKAALLVLVIAAPLPAHADETLDSWELCRAATVRAEAGRDLPPHLLTAISQSESGRWHAGRSETLAWPWTVVTTGKAEGPASATLAWRGETQQVQEPEALQAAAAGLTGAAP